MATPKQTKISAFFASSADKKRKDTENKEEGPTKSNKKLKLDGEEEAKDDLDVKDVVNDENSPAEGNKGGVSTKTSVAAVLKETTASPAASPAAAEEPTPAEAADAATEESPSPQLSPEIREKMAKNKMAAKLKLLSTKTNGLVTDFGASWLSTLEPEFSKDYFLKLSRFVAAGE